MADFAQTKKHNLSNVGNCSKCTEMAKALLSSSSVRKSSQGRTISNLHLDRIITLL
jgi:hypothetical protein